MKKQKKATKFKSEWKQELEWLEYDTFKDVMYCDFLLFFVMFLLQT